MPEKQPSGEYRTKQQAHPEPPSHPIVVCICGMLAAGKSTLARAIAEYWRPAPVLAFDDYAQYTRWPTDLQRWVRGGADPALVSNSRLRDDLDALVNGRHVRHPLTQADLVPSPLVLLEDPFGRTRPDIRDLIDFVLFIDLPADLSVVRLVRRSLLQSPPDCSPNAAEDSSAFLAKRVEATARWLEHYLAHRQMYVGADLLDPIRKSADAVLDGEKPQDEIRADAISHMENWLGTPCS